MEMLFRNIYRQLWLEGTETSPRGQLVKEFENFHVDIPPYARFTNFEARKLNLDYIRRELLWYLRGDAKDLSICSHAKMWNSLITKEGEIYSNYGQYIWGRLNQFSRCYDLMVADKDTRRAVITILQPHHLLDIDAPEICCTLNLGFRIRHNKLNMSVSLRSQDAILGFGNDLPFFSILWEMMYIGLKVKYPELEMGTYHHYCHSFHVYERHYKMIQDIVNGSTFTHVDCPKMHSANEVEWLVNYAINPKNVDSNYKTPFINWVMEVVK